MRKNLVLKASVQSGKVAAKQIELKDGESSLCLNKIKVHGMPVRMDGKRINSKNSHWDDIIDTIKKRKTAVDAQIEEYITRNSGNPELALSVKRNYTNFTLGKLQKLPLVGIKYHVNRCDFEWPKSNDVSNL